MRYIETQKYKLSYMNDNTRPGDIYSPKTDGSQMLSIFTDEDCEKDDENCVKSKVPAEGGTRKNNRKRDKMPKKML